MTVPEGGTPMNKGLKSFFREYQIPGNSSIELKGFILPED